MSSVALDGLTKAFDTVVAVDGVSLTFRDGGFTALLGPSGCGKSTLLRLIAGLERPTRGAIRIGDRDVTALSPERRDVGMMFQSYALFPHMSVAQNLAFPLKMKKVGDRQETARRIEDALDLVRLSGFGDRGIRQLSGGQQQRVALARAFIANPRVLLLDEPLSNLDARLREDMQVELIELHKKLGLTTIFVTHDQEEALSLADHVVLMRNGRIEQQGDPESLYAQPASAFAADFIGAANLIDVVLRRSGEAWVADVAGHTVTVPAPADGEAGPRRLVLRQEDLSLSAEAPQDRAALPATVRTRVYIGGAARFVVEVGDGTISVVTSKHVRARAGDCLFLSWDPDHVLVL